MSRAVELFKQIVPIANPSSKEAEIRSFIQSTLSKAGLNDQHVDDTGNLLVRIPGDSDKKTYLLSAHMDSVPPCEGIVPVEDTRDGRAIIRSEGKTILGADDKSGVAVMIAIAERIQAEAQGKNHPLELLFSTQEEVGLLGLKAFDVTQCNAKSAFVLDGEGHVGDIFHAGPSQKSLVFEFEGLASHAGIAPEAGVSAIEMAAKLCSVLPSGRISADTTMNLGLIDGGFAINIVAPKAIMKGEARSHNDATLEALLAEVANHTERVQKEFPKGNIQFIPTHKYNGFVVPVEHPVVEAASYAAKAIGLTPKIKPMNIGSDAHILNHKGIFSVVLGMGFHFSHSLGEYIDEAELASVSQWVWEITCPS